MGLHSVPMQLRVISSGYHFTLSLDELCCDLVEWIGIPSHVAMGLLMCEYVRCLVASLGGVPSDLHSMFQSVLICGHKGL